MNSSYKQFTETPNIEDNIKNYMHNQLDLIYSLEIIEANELIKRDDKADYLKKLTQANGPKTQAIDTFSSVSNLELKSVNDFVDNDLVVKRYDYSKRTPDQSHAENNDYHTIPLFSSFYAGSENPNGSVGDVALRRLSFELLGEFGYTNGLVPYMSNKYIKDGVLTDSDILPKIFNGKYTSMKAFKKEMYNQRIKKLDKIKDVNFEYGGKTYKKADIEGLMKEAIEKDKNLNGQNPTNYTFSSNVEKLKKSIYSAYKKETRDFRDNIYNGENPKANKSELEKALKSAEEAKKDIKTSTDGKDIEPTDKWATAEAMKALDEAIAEANKVNEDENAKQTDVDAKKEKLDKAIEKFQKSVKAGLKVNEPSETNPNPDVKNPSETNPDKAQNDKNKDSANSVKNKPLKPNNGIKTGDTANAMGYIGLGLVALGAVYIIARKKRSL